MATSAVAYLWEGQTAIVPLGAENVHNFAIQNQGRSDGGYIGIYSPPPQISLP